MLSCSCSAPHTPIFHVDFKTGKPADEKWNGVGWREPISSSLVKISWGSLERMLCVKEPAKWQNTAGGFIIIFSLLCMYNDCPHYKTQDDVHITLPQTALKQVHLLYITVDVLLITWSFSLFVYMKWAIWQLNVIFCKSHWMRSDGIIPAMYNTFVHNNYSL